MKKSKSSSKDKPHPMLHGQNEGMMPSELMKKKSKSIAVSDRKKTAKMKGK